jgi:hypothetical protein
MMLISRYNASNDTARLSKDDVKPAIIAHKSIGIWTSYNPHTIAERNRYFNLLGLSLGPENCLVNPQPLIVRDPVHNDMTNEQLPQERGPVSRERYLCGWSLASDCTYCRRLKKKCVTFTASVAPLSPDLLCAEMKESVKKILSHCI